MDVNMNKSLAQDKVLILYVLSNVKTDVTESDIFKIISPVNNINYFYFKQILADLVDSKLVQTYTKDEDADEKQVLYKLTFDGQNSLNLTIDVLPGLLKLKIDNVLKNLNKSITQTNRYTYRQNYIKIYFNDWINDYLIKYPDYFKNDNEFKKLINAINQEYDKLNQEFITIIKYDYLSSSLRHKIITSSGITVCPYCNRQYISYFSNKGVKYTTADLDHFYPKSIFSLFALSLYNFIPACQICNQRF